jgi:hypothetical protein
MTLRITLLGLLTAGLLRAETFTDSQSETHPLDPRGRIQIEDTNGSITIKTSDRPEVSIEVEKRASSEEYLSEIHVEIGSDPKAISVKTTFPSRVAGWLWGRSDYGEVRLTLTVPESAELTSVTLANGPITIDGVHGFIKASTVNGGIHVTGIRETVALTTVNGSIHAEVAALGPGGHLNFTTVNGSVAILLPKNAGATLSTATVNGRTSCDLPMQSVDTFWRHGLTGIIGAGGGSIRAVTVNGSVHLQSL